jgi:5,8-dihydroxy-2-naphthoate synthase
VPSKRRVYTLGHSPDPDDAFMFYAIAENKIDLRGYQFDQRLEDIQTLNERAMRGELDISAISIHAYAYVSDRYALLPCGASMGDGYGPLIVGTESLFKGRRNLMPNGNQTENATQAKDLLQGKKIAVPGRMTSAYLAARLCLGDFQDVVIPFDRIFDAVKRGEADAGLIIHEGQLTYARAGFSRILDLGCWWKKRTGLPLPLGGNVIRRDIIPAIQSEMSQIMRESIEYGLAHREEAVRHSLPYARDMDAPLAGKFIGMYVNDFTRDYGETGRAAIREFLGQGRKAGHIAKEVAVEFVE